MQISENYPVTAADMYAVTERIINTPWERRFDNLIPAWKRILKQCDLFKLNHFDNEAKRCSLKQLEFVMRSDDIQDLPYPPGVPLEETDEVANVVLTYNRHDVGQTAKFANHCKKAIDFRASMTEKYGKDFTNFNDTKIGKQYFQMCLEKAGIKLRDDNGQLIQTHRDYLDLGDLVFPYVRFERPEFQAVIKQLNASRITETKGALNIKTTVDGFEFVFGLGGIHGSVSGESFFSDDEFVVIDADVASYYPNIAIKNKVYPEHLTEKFCEVYEDVYNQRKSYKKGTVENAAMKLALNGVYGDSNSKYSVFYDPKYTMTTTINGQLMLCMLAEQLMKIPRCTMIQINTDGLTVKCPRDYMNHYYSICDWWQKLTNLELEYVDYKAMYVRDVNNYIAVGIDDKIKKKGAYVDSGAHEEGGELGWHQNHDALVIKKAASAAILNGVSIPEFIRNHDDIFDFFLLAKVGRTDSLELRNDIDWDGVTVFENQTMEKIQRISRYYVSNDGDRLVKIMKPLKRRTNNVDMVYRGWVSKKVSGFNKNLTVTSQYEYDNALAVGYRSKDGGDYTHTPKREIGIQSEYTVTVVNTITPELTYDVNYAFYIKEAEKLVNGVLGIR